MDRPSVPNRRAMDVRVSPLRTVYSANVGAGVGVGGPGGGVGAGVAVGVGVGVGGGGAVGLTAPGRQAPTASGTITSARAMGDTRRRTTVRTGRRPSTLTPPRRPSVGRPGAARRR